MQRTKQPMVHFAFDHHNQYDLWWPWNGPSLFDDACYYMRAPGSTPHTHGTYFSPINVASINKIHFDLITTPLSHSFGTSSQSEPTSPCTRKKRFLTNPNKLYTVCHTSEPAKMVHTFLVYLPNLMRVHLALVVTEVSSRHGRRGEGI